MDMIGTFSQERFPITKYFSYRHLPEHLQEVSKLFAELVAELSKVEYTDPREVSAGLRKLVEAKDCFVRAALK